MLLSYSIENFKSIKLKETISFVVLNKKSFNHHLLLNDKILPIVSIFGTNGGGKSSVIESLEFLIKLIFSNQFDNINLINNLKYLKNKQNDKKQPTVWELRFLTNDNNYELIYKISISDKIDFEEYKYINLKDPYKNEILVFSKVIKDNEIIYKFCDELKANKFNLDMIQTTMLNFLSYYVFDQKIQRLFNEIKKIFFIDSSYKNEHCNPFLNRFDIDIDFEFFKSKKDKVLEALKETDFNIVDFIIEHNIAGNYDIKTIKNNCYGKTYILPYSLESEGTKKFISLILKILKHFDNQSILFIDDLDSQLHTSIVKYIISIFNSKLNIGSQLIMTAHNTEILNNKLLRKDEIYFAALNESYFTNLVCLQSFSSNITNDLSISKQYLEDKFGYVPHIECGLNWLKKGKNK